MTESIQKVLTRVRAPRVKITYDVETGGAIEKKELPFVIGVISDLFGHTVDANYKQRQFTSVDADNFTQLMQAIKPSLHIKVDNMINSQPDEHLALDLTFTCMDDFEPDALVHKVPELEQMLNNRTALLDLSSKLDSNDNLDDLLTKIAADAQLTELFTDLEQNKEKIEQLLIEGKLIGAQSDASTVMRNAKLIQAFLSLAQSQTTDAKNNYSFILLNISKLDVSIGKQLDAILHNADFQSLEGKWRGLQYLIDNCELGTYLKVKVFCATRTEIQADLDKATQFDQSLLFKKIYEEEFGTFGGSPFSCMILDSVHFSKDPIDISLLEQLTSIAAASHAPLLATVAPSMFGLSDFTQLPNPRDLAKIFESTEFAAWNSFRATEDARYCTLTLPRILARLPYGAKTKPVACFDYEESVNGSDNAKFCWSNAAYALGTKIAHAFSLYHWTASIRGVEGGGLVEQLPTYTYKTSEGDLLLKCPTEIAITDRREKELSDLGFIALCHRKNTDNAAFFSGQTVQKPKAYNTSSATANANLSARLPYMLNTSRFAHYIKMIMRDKIGSLMSKSDTQSYLQTWIAQYVLLSDIATQETKARYPLREAKIDVINDPSNPGAYKAVLFLRPHFQMEELTVSLRLVADIPTK